MTFRMTDSTLKELRTKNGGYTRHQLEILGVAWPPKKGWETRVVGKVFEVKHLERLLDLRDGLPRTTHWPWPLVKSLAWPDDPLEM